jgi:hypothetical protein
MTCISQIKKYFGNFLVCRSRQVFLLVLPLLYLLAYEESFLKEQLWEATKEIPPQTPVYRQIFRTLLLNNRPLVKYWADLLWKQIPADLRIQCLDEIENDLIILREEKLMNFLWNKVTNSQTNIIFHSVGSQVQQS